MIEPPKLSHRNGMRVVDWFWRDPSCAGLNYYTFSCEVITNAYNKDTSFINPKPERVPKELWDDVVTKSMALIA